MHSNTDKAKVSPTLVAQLASGGELKLLLALLLTCTVWLAGLPLRAQQTSPADRLFAMVGRLEKSAPWKLEDIDTIEKITGRSLKQDGVAKYVSDEMPDDKLLRYVIVLTDPSEGRVTSVWLCLPRQGLGISRVDVVAKYGKWSCKNKKDSFGSMEREGFHTAIGYEYKRKTCRWLTFEFDDDKTKQLRIVEITP